MLFRSATFLAAEKGDGKAGEPQAAPKAPAQLHQSHVIVPAKLRFVTLISYLRSVFSRRGRTMKAIVFVSCADSVDFHFDILKDPKKAEVGADDVKNSTKTDTKDAASKEADLVSKTVGKSAYITSPASPEIVLHRMHGSLSQPIRTATLKSYSACKLPSVLITDRKSVV